LQAEQMAVSAPRPPQRVHETHLGQKTLPRPLHVGHAVAVWPLPLHVEQTALPDPPQVPQVT